MEIVKITDCSKFIAQDNAIVQEIVSPRNSSVKNQSLAKVIIQPGNSVLAEKYYAQRFKQFFNNHNNFVFIIIKSDC
jgi:hypothetical protein